jgi:hypothetical protein
VGDEYESTEKPGLERVLGDVVFPFLIPPHELSLEVLVVGRHFFFEVFTDLPMVVQPVE